MVVAGLFGALTHYHSESMECLQHADEQHYVQNDEFFCPICIPAQSNIIDDHTISHSLTDTHESVTSFEKIYVEKLRTGLNTSRAPPVVS